MCWNFCCCAFDGAVTSESGYRWGGNCGYSAARVKQFWLGCGEIRWCRDIEMSLCWKERRDERESNAGPKLMARKIAARRGQLSGKRRSLPPPSSHIVHVGHHPLKVALIRTI